MNAINESLSPSLLAQMSHCDRRAWLAANRLRVEPQIEEQPQRHLPEQGKNWLYEVALPSGARIDGWCSSEHVAVEFKTTAPHIAHVIQGWAYAKELQEIGVEEVEMQLWYPKTMQKKVKALAEAMGLPFQLIPQSAMTALWLNPPEVDFIETIEKARHTLRQITQKAQPPAAKSQDDSSCRECIYHDFCHL